MIKVLLGVLGIVVLGGLIDYISYQLIVNRVIAHRVILYNGKTSDEDTAATDTDSDSDACNDCAVGVDGLFIGPLDLSGSMGITGQMEHPDMVAPCGRYISNEVTRGA